MPAEGIATPPSTILIVDDSPTNLQVLIRTLSGTGHRILAAKDGPTAIDIARRTQPDLILLDVMMPGMDGFEVLRKLKSKPDTSDTLVIFLSARGRRWRTRCRDSSSARSTTSPSRSREKKCWRASPRTLSRRHLER
jgi:CheY-like chemotaxis protein